MSGMELTAEKQTIIMLSLESRIAELKDRIECFEEAVAEGEERFKESLERSRDRKSVV